MKKSLIGTKLLIENAKQILTMQGESSHDVGLIENGSVYIEDDKIVALGPKAEIDALVPDKKGVTVIDATGKVVTPGFVDPHTHTVFGGSRVAEYAVKMTDPRPETLKKLGIPTGAYASVNMTRDLPIEKLAEQTEKRMRHMLINGTTTLESKSGYAFTLPGEMKMLEVNRLMSGILPLDIVSTFLGAHGWAEGMDKDVYIDLLCKEMIPQVAAFHMAAFNDIWVDEGNFTAADAEKVLGTGKDYGLIPTIHTGAYSDIGGAKVAIALGAASAAHLNYTPAELYPQLRDAGVVGILAVTTDFVVAHKKPVQPRPMLEAGMTLALATNCNPGCWVESVPFAMALACRRHGMAPVEAFRAATYGGACALTLKDRGRLDKDMIADLLIFDVDTFEDVIYKFGTNLVEKVIKKGRVVVDGGRILENEED